MITLTYRPEHLQATGGRVVMVWSISSTRGEAVDRSSESIFDLLRGAS